MIRIDIDADPIAVRTGNKDGRTWTRREQRAYVHVGFTRPSPFLLNLGDTTAPYAPGSYTIDPASLKVGQYGDLQFGREIKLIPVDTKAKA